MKTLTSYEKYQYEWLMEHGYSLDDFINSLDELQKEDPHPSIKELFKEWEFHGFNGEVYSCGSEFHDNEALETPIKDIDIPENSKFMKEGNTLLINLTELGIFSGLYESIWLNEGTDERIIEDILLDNPALKPEDIEISVDIKKYLQEIGETYCSYFENQIGGIWDIYSTYSPKYYNYETDEIVICCKDCNAFILDNALWLEKELESIDKYDVEYYNIYDKHYGYEGYERSITIKTKQSVPGGF